MLARVVVDASVVFKWIVAEPDSAVALMLSMPDIDALAPAFMPLEIAHGLRGRFVRGLMTEDLVYEASNHVPALPVQLLPFGSLVGGALQFAIQYRCSVYDSLYAVLAFQEGCPYVTADRKFYDATVALLPETMVFIDQIPKLVG